MPRKLEEKLERIQELILAIREKKGKYVLPKDQLIGILNDYCVLLNALRAIRDERQRAEFLWAEYRLAKLGLKGVDPHIN
jgi:hypothetical protein